MTDIRRLPPPDISRLPAPDISRLPPPEGDTPGKEFGPSKVEHEVENRSFLDKPGNIADPTTEKEVEEIAARHGVDAHELRRLAPYFGARMGGTPYMGEDELKRAAGGLGQFAFGVPQKLYKKAQTPEMERALDELQNLAQGRQSWLQFGTEIAAPVGPLGAASKSVGKAVAKGAAVGAVAGAAGSGADRELEGAATGVVLGGAISGVAQRLLGRGNGPRGPQVELPTGSLPTESKFVADVLERDRPEIEKGTQEILAARKASNTDIEAAITGGLDIDEQVADRIVREQVGEETLQRLADESSEAGRIYSENLGQYTTKKSGIETELAQVEDAFRMTRESLVTATEDPLHVRGELDKVSNRMARERKTLDKLLDQQSVTEVALKGRRSSESRAPLEKRLERIRAEQFERAQTLQGLVDDFGTVETRLQEAISAGKAQDKLVPLSKDLQVQRSRLQAALEKLEAPTPVEPTSVVKIRMAQDIVRDKARDFAKFLDGGDLPRNLEDAQEIIGKYARGQGGIEAVQKKWQVFLGQEAGLDYVVGKHITQAGREGAFGTKAANYLSDAQFVIRDIDDKAGTTLEPLHRELNELGNRRSFVVNEFRKQLGEIYKANRSIDNSLITGNPVYGALDTGNIAGLSDQELRAYHGFRDYFRSGLEFVNGKVKDKDPGITPLSIEARENYVPHIFKNTEDLVLAVEQKLRETGVNVASLDKASFKELTAQEGPLKDILQLMSVLDSRGISSGAELVSRVKDTFQTREGRAKLETLARAALERKDVIPLWARETNLYKLADSWIGNTTRHLYLRNTIDRMAAQVRVLEKAGAEVEARYVRNLLADLQGIRKGTAAEATLNARIGYQKSIDKLSGGRKDPVTLAAAAVAKAIPEVLSDLTKQIYPNLLGLSPRALIMNATQTFAKTIPELGQDPYSYALALRGAVRVAKNLKAAGQKVSDWGLAPAEFVAKYRRTTADGIRRSSLYAIPNQVLTKMGDLTMIPYTKMDMANRALVLSMAEMLAYDLAGGSAAAQKALRRLPATVRSQVSKAGSEEEVARILASHLNASTQYHYNRASMSEWGRVGGPLLSTFSKWPTATAGEILQEYREKGAVRGSTRLAGKFVAPYILFQAADYLISQTGDAEGIEGIPVIRQKEKLSDRQQKFFGKGGLSQAAPIGALEGILSGDFFTPPVVDAILSGTLVPLMKGDDKKMQKGLSSTIQNFTPGSVYVRFLTDDLVTLLSGERPEGGDFLERSEEGLRRIRKEIK